jgi:hypothetical protein
MHEGSKPPEGNAPDEWEETSDAAAIWVYIDSVSMTLLWATRRMPRSYEDEGLVQQVSAAAPGCLAPYRHLIGQVMQGRSGGYGVSSGFG